jgi:Bacterial Ig-like domain/Bacterial Ig domain
LYVATPNIGTNNYNFVTTPSRYAILNARATGDKAYQVNGKTEANIAGNTYTTTPVIGKRRNSGSTYDQFLNGEVNEIINYPTALSNVNRQKVDSYLATKYGITLDQTTPLSYIMTDATVFWDATTNTAYKNNITAIGRDDAEALYQKQSKSINTTGLVTVGRGGISTTNVLNTNTFANDKSYFAFGDDNGTLVWSTVGAPTDRKILGRKFKAQSTNFSETVKISAPDDSSSLTTKLPTEAGGKVYMLVDNDGDGNFTTGVQQEIEMTLVGTEWDPVATIPNGAVFTFATLADLGVTVEQAGSDPQAIGTGSTLVPFLVTFSQNIDPTTLGSTDVTLTGSAIGCTIDSIVATPLIQNKIFTLTIDCGTSDTNHDKTILASIAPGGVESGIASSLVNQASTSIDNSVMLADVTPPAAPSSAPDMTALTDTGSSNTDDYTSNNLPVFTGTCTFGENVGIFVDGNFNASAPCSASGTYTIPAVTIIPDGPHNVTARFGDAQNNISGDSPVLAIVVDTTAPLAPFVSDVAGDTIPTYLTSDTTPTITGTAEPGSTIEIKDASGATLGTVTTDASGNWSFTLTSPLAE